MKNFDLIIGYEDIKAELRMALDTIKNPEKYKMLGVKPSRGILLHGHPGVGKTYWQRLSLRQVAENISFAEKTSLTEIL